MRPETLTPQPSVGTEYPASVQLDHAAPSSRHLGALSIRFYVGLIGLFAICVTLFLTAWAVLPNIVPGWRSVVITSGSMAPSIRTGDVVLAVPTEGQELVPGTVIVFDDPAMSGLTTHRIIAVNPDGSYRTQGDANSAADSTPVQPEHVVAKARVLVPYAGLPLVWYWKAAWFKLAIWGLLVLASLWVTRFAHESPPWPGVGNAAHRGKGD
jgi:signal peptidase I